MCNVRDVPLEIEREIFRKIIPCMTYDFYYMHIYYDTNRISYEARNMI